MPFRIDYHEIPRHLIVVFLVFVIIISALGYYHYGNQKLQIRQRIENELVAIANLKAEQIVSWRKERLGGAAAIMDDSFIVPDIQRFLNNQAAPAIKGKILKWMNSFKKSDQYENILLMDKKRHLRLSVNPEKDIGPDALRLVSEAMTKKLIGFSDLYTGKVSGKVRMSLVVPIIVGTGTDAAAVGAVILRINPDDFLYPLVRRWPTPSNTAETMLVRREGNDVVYLNSRGNGGTLTLRLPMNSSMLPAASSARGEEGIIEGVDYRGVRVLAATKSIAGSPWHIVAKVDTDEIFAPINQIFWSMALIVIGLIGAAGASIAFIWRNQYARYYRAQYESELSRVALLRHYEPLTRYANDSIFLLDREGNILEANERAVSMLGYALEKLLHMNVRNLGSPRALLDIDALTKQLEMSEDKGFVVESEHNRPDGTTFPVEASVRAFEIEGRVFFQAIIRDITERKAAERRINAMNALLELFMKKTSRGEYLASVVKLIQLWSGCSCAGIRMRDKCGNIPYESYVGFSTTFWNAENGLSVNEHQCACIRVILGTPEGHDADCMTRYGSFRCNNAPVFFQGVSEERHKKYRNGCADEGFMSIAIIPIRYQGTIWGAIHLADEKPGMASSKTLEFIESMSPLIGEAVCRFSTEEALKLSEEHYRSLIESSSDCIYQLTPDGAYLSMNTKTSAFYGLDSPQELIGKEFSEHITDNREPVQRAIRKAGNGETISVRYKASDSKGREVWWDARLSPIRGLKGTVISILGISRDVTGQMKAEKELKSSHEQLRHLSAHLQTILEEERTKIACEVHDELGQVLTALKMETAWLAGKLSADQKDLVEKTHAMVKLIDTNIQAVKRICTELRPTLLDHLGLPAAIEWQAEEFRNRTGIDFDLHICLQSASKTISTVLFRVFQETLTNIMRHANATKVRAVLKQEGGTVLMKITDNGKGITREQLAKPRSFGLLGMKERVHYLGGEVRIRGLRDRGTTIRVNIPADLKG